MLTNSISTARLVLRPPVGADLDRFYAIHSDPDANRFNPSGPMTSMDVAAQTFARWLQHWEQHGYGQWAVATLADPARVIGFGGLALRPYGAVERVNLGYRFDPQAFGLGYATELAAAARDAGFMQMGFDDIFGLVRPAHAVSIRVLEKIGMHLVDVLDDVPGQDPSLVYSVTIRQQAETGSQNFLRFKVSER